MLLATTMEVKSVVLFCAILLLSGIPSHVQASHNNSDVLPAGYVSGGAPAGVGQFPWIVRLSIRDRVTQGTYMCAGSLISMHHVLSAAHCVDLKIEHYSDIKIFLGEYNTETFPKDCVQDKCTNNVVVHPSKIISHPKYDKKSISNDIALLKLQKRAPHSATIKPIALPPFDLDTPSNDGATVLIAGWGRTEKGYTSTILLSTEISTISKEKCLAKDPNVPANHFCAGDLNGKDTCPGDSGGPLMMKYKNKYYLAGIVSYGPDVKCGTSKAGYYTNVYKYVKWIKSNA